MQALRLRQNFRVQQPLTVINAETTADLKFIMKKQDPELKRQALKKEMIDNVFFQKVWEWKQKNSLADDYMLSVSAMFAFQYTLCSFSHVVNRAG
jgi:hypothetical protein